jgi:predicted DNA binding CopG/RHH family protein
MNKKLPAFKSDDEAAQFLNRDLTDYINANNLAPSPFEYRPKQKSINLRISEELLNAVRVAARRRRIPYQRFIRQALETVLSTRK